MKRKSLNVQKLKFIDKDKKFSKLYSKLSKIISRNKNINSFTVAVSGGPDSMALAGLSNLLMNKENYKVFFVLVDHGIRKDSKKEALQVKKVLSRNNIKLRILSNNTKILSNIQKNARDIRYKLLSDFCKKNKVKYLITAHHQDDQIETFLIRLSRGSGVEGLSSMNEKTELKKGFYLLRPFLDIEKSELSYVSKKIFNKTFKDPTNKNKKFLRTNIRNLKKILEKKGINPQRIANSIRNISLTKEAINFYVKKSIKKHVKFKKKETILNFTDFRKEPKEIKFRIMNNIVKKRGNNYYPPRSYKIVNLIDRFETNKLSKCTLGGCVFEKKKNLLHVYREI